MALDCGRHNTQHNDIQHRPRVEYVDKEHNQIPPSESNRQYVIVAYIINVLRLQFMIIPNMASTLNIITILILIDDRNMFLESSVVIVQSDAQNCGIIFMIIMADIFACSLNLSLVEKAFLIKVSMLKQGTLARLIFSKVVGETRSLP